MAMEKNKERSLLNSLRAGGRWFIDRLRNPVNFVLLTLTGVAAVTRAPLFTPLAVVTGISFLAADLFKSRHPDLLKSV